MLRKKRLIAVSFLLPVALGFSCKKHYTIEVQNLCFADTVMVEYVNLDDGDTSVVHLNPMDGQKIYDSHALYGNNNWDLDFRVHIIHVENTTGDTLNFDPNRSSDWFYESNNTNYRYSLKLQEPAFQ